MEILPATNFSTENLIRLLIQVSPKVYLSNTLSYIRGDGYFITSYPVSWGYDFSYFKLNPFFTQDSSTYNPAYYLRNQEGTLYHDPVKGYEVSRTNLVGKLFVNNDDFGWYPKLQWKHSDDKGNLVFGGELRFHKSEHYGEISSADVLPPGTPPNYQFYYYNGKKTTASVFGNEIFNITKKISAMAGIQFAYNRYTIENQKFSPYNFTVSYNFFTPRIGLNCNITNNFRMFGNFSMAKREPRIKDIYDAENPYARPNFRVVDTVNKIYEDPFVKPEKMLNYELGFGYTSSMLNTNLNFYWMDFTDEIVNNGQLDNVGQPISGNAGKSVHRGIEFEFTLVPFFKMPSSSLLKPLSLSGNLNLSDNYFVDYREVTGVDNSGNIIYGNDYSGNNIILNPQILANLSLNYQTDFGVGAFISINTVGKQYLDNSENEIKNPSLRNVPGYVDKFINAYTVFNAGVSIDIMNVLARQSRSNLFKSVELRFMINNIFDVLYETTGNVDWTGTPNWIPAATRNFWMDFKIGL